MADIFLSYNREDQATARLYVEAFKREKLSVWWDTTLKVGEAYDVVTEVALRDAKAVVVLWSARSVLSRWVRAEATVAERAKTLVPVMIEPCQRPIMFELTHTAELGHWKGAANDEAWIAFLADVRRFCGVVRVAPESGEGLAQLIAPSAPRRETLLAVLAFDNLSNDPDLSYFSDGVSEEILYTVARAKGLRVIGKASSFQFRGPDKTPQEIVQALGATHMLDGSVRRSGDSIRISAELVDTATLQTLWSERYDRALTDIFALQDEIAGAIAAALDHHFAPARVPLPIDPTAYDLYLQARAVHAQDYTWADQAKCIELLEGAIGRAPNFAEAWGRLAIYRRGEHGIAEAQHGLALNPDCATSLAGLAMSLPPFAKHAEKLALAERAYLLAPDDHLVGGVYTILLLSLGLLGRACVVSAERATRDPLSPLVAGSLAIVYRSAGRRAEAIALADRAIASFPDAQYVKFIRGLIAIFDGDIEHAAAVAATMSTTEGDSALRVLVTFTNAVASMNPASQAASVDRFLRRNAPTAYVTDAGLAAAMGAGDVAFDYLLETIRDRHPVGFTLDKDGRAAGNDAAITSGLFLPNCEVLRRDVRFAEVCVRLGLYQCWQETKRWPDCVSEVAPYYDLKAECAKLASVVDLYDAQPASSPYDARPSPSAARYRIAGRPGKKV